MKKEKLYILILITITTLVIVSGTLSLNYLYSTTKQSLLQTQLQSGKRESREIAKLLEQQLASGIDKNTITNNLQKSIENTDTQSEFICMYNTNGIELCHPDPSHIGYVITNNNSTIKDNTNQETSFKALLNQGQSNGGVRVFNANDKTEIIYVQNVKNTDWMVASHANMYLIENQLQQLYYKFLVAYILSGILIIAGCFIAVKLLKQKMEHEAATEKLQLNTHLHQLQALNQKLLSNQQALELQLQQNEESKAPLNKERILVYKKDELISLTANSIALVYTENAATHIVTFTNEIYYANQSLDDFLKPLNPKMFYRANRQFIINIKAITTIQRYGKNQLKLITTPETAELLLISKNKVAEFKEWLDQ